MQLARVFARAIRPATAVHQSSHRARPTARRFGHACRRWRLRELGARVKAVVGRAAAWTALLTALLLLLLMLLRRVPRTFGRRAIRTAALPAVLGVPGGVAAVLVEERRRFTIGTMILMVMMIVLGLIPDLRRGLSVHLSVV